MKAVSVLVVTWNNEPSIGRCIDAVARAAECLRIEVLVWDNASSDGTARVVAERRPDLLVRSRSNIGFARAVNSLARQANGDWLLLLNPDAYLEAGSLDILANDAPDASVIGGQLVDACGNVQAASARSFPSPSSILKSVVLRRRPAWTPGQVRREVDAVSGACMLVPRRLWERLDGLDESYSHSGEDIDFCLRVWRSGGRVVYEPAARARHEGEASVRQAPPEIDVLRWAGAVRFIHRHRGWPAALTVRAVLGSHAALVVLAGVCGFRRSRRSFRRAKIVWKWAVAGSTPALPQTPETVR